MTKPGIKRDACLRFIRFIVPRFISLVRAGKDKESDKARDKVGSRLRFIWFIVPGFILLSHAWEDKDHDKARDKEHDKARDKAGCHRKALRRFD